MLTKEYLESLFKYDPDSGILYRKTSRNQFVKGCEAGTIMTRHGKSYRRIGIDGRYYLAHRLVWFIVNGCFPEHEIDHIDGNGLNNKIDNLRCVTHLENGRNRKMPSNNTSGYVGVYWDKRAGKWNAKIRYNKVLINIGSFDSREEAKAARESHICFPSFHENHGSIRPL